MDLPATQILNDADDDNLSSQSLNSSQLTPKRVHQVASLCIGDKKYPIFKGINKIGRHPGSDICINDLSVSKNHAEIEMDKNCFFICDLRSSNKTRINNETLRPDRFYQIVDGSKLTFGIINAQFFLLRDNNDSIIVPETPATGLKLRYDGEKSSITDSDDSVVFGTQETKDEAVFAKPTLPIRSPSTRDNRTNKARRQLNTSIHDIETQKEADENNDPSIFDCETQKVDNSNKKNSIYDVETQQLDEHAIKSEVFDLATQKLPEEADTEADIYSMSTQKLNIPDSRGIHDLNTQKVDLIDEVSGVYDASTQRINVDDDIYDCETQRINKQFEITISKSKKSRVPNKNSNAQTKVASVPQRSDIKNGEEDEKKEQQVSTVFDDSETDDELIDEMQFKQSSSVHQSSSEISKKSKDNKNKSSVSVNIHNHIIAETDDESETDDEEAAINPPTKAHVEVSNDDKKPSKNDEIGSGSETNDEEELALIQDKKQSNKNNDNDSETDDEISTFNKPESSIKSGDKKVFNKGVDCKAENNACSSPVLVDFSKLQQPGADQNDDETDDEDVYVTPKQVVSPHKKVLAKTEGTGLERYDTAPLETAEPLEPVDSPRNNEFECDPDAPTQIIPNACERTNKIFKDKNHEDGDDFAPTQLMNPENNLKDDDETDGEELELSRNKKNEVLSIKEEINKIDELAETQIIDFTKKTSKICDPDPNDAPTQLLNLETQACQSGIEDTQKILETQRDDLEPTQLIDTQPSCSSSRQTRSFQPEKINKQSSDRNKINNDNVDSDDFENAPTQIINFENSEISRGFKNDKLGKNSSPSVSSRKFSRRASSTPNSSVKRKMSLSAMKNLRVNLDKLSDAQADNKRVNDEERKLKDNADKDNNLNDSIVKNLDAMFGGSNDDELEDAIPLQTQQLEEILSDVPEKLSNVNNFQKPGSQENKTNLRNRKTGESQVGSRSSTPDTQEVYFAKLSSKKKKFNVLLDSQGSSGSQKSRKSQRKTSKEIVYAPGIAGFSNGVPVESDESVPLCESPEKKVKQKAEVTEKGGKSESETKKTVVPVNEDDFFAGLPDVRIAGTEDCPASSTVSSSDSEEDSYSSDNIVKKLKKSLAEIKANKHNDEDDDDFGAFSSSKLIPKQSNSSFTHTDINLPKIKNIDDDDSSSDGEVDFARLKQLADRLLNANDKEKILTGLRGVGSKNKNNKQVKTDTSQISDRKPVRKRVLPQKFRDGASTANDSTFNDDAEDDSVPAKRSRKSRKNSEANLSTVSTSSSVGVKPTQAKAKKNAAPKRGKKVDVNQSLSSTSISSATEDQKSEVLPKKQAANKRSKKVDQSLCSTSVSSGAEEQKFEAPEKPEPKKRTAAKRTKKVDTDQSDFDTSVSSTMSSSILNSSIVSKRARVSVLASSSTSARARHSIRPAEKMQYKIIFTGINYENHEKAIQRLGGIISNDPTTGTILVTDKIRRTLKFICAISRSIPIVSEEWINTSISSNRFVETDDFILSDPAAENKWGFCLKQSLIKSKEKSLLHNLTFVITAGVFQPSVNELKNMIQVAGGKPLVRAPKTWDNTFIISCKADIPKVKKLIANIPKNAEVPVVTTEFLLSGILKQELDVENHKLSF